MKLPKVPLGFFSAPFNNGCAPHRNYSKSKTKLTKIHMYKTTTDYADFTDCLISYQ